MNKDTYNDIILEAETGSSQDTKSVMVQFQHLTLNPFLRSKHVFLMKRASLGSFCVAAQILLL